MDKDDRVRMIMRRVSELQEFLRTGRGDPRFIRSMLQVNEQILTLMTLGHPVRFYKVEETVEIKPSLKKVFFCPPKKSDDPSSQ